MFGEKLSVMIINENFVSFDVQQFMTRSDLFIVLLAQGKYLKRKHFLITIIDNKKEAQNKTFGSKDCIIIDNEHME